MKSLHLITITIGILLIIISCSKETLVPNESISDYSNLQTGNYWIYDWYNITSEGGESYYLTDTVLIEKDTLIEGRTFFIKSGTFLGNEFRSIEFDSINSLYSFPSRELIFTIDPELQFQKNFGPDSEPIAIGNYELQNDLELIELQSGAFLCLNFRGVIESTDPDYEYGTRYNNNYYSKNVGLVKTTTQYLQSPNNLERRLIKFGKQ